MPPGADQDPHDATAFTPALRAGRSYRRRSRARTRALPVQECRQRRRLQRTSSAVADYGLAAVITVRLTQRQPARWLIPLASGAAFFGAATVAGSDGLPTVRAHVPLRTYADGDRQTLTVAGLERFGLRARRIEKAQERMADICTGGSETACETAMRSGVLPAIEDYRKSLVEVVEPLAPGSKCVAALDAHSRALAAFAATTREFMAAELDRDVDRAQELEQGQAARTIMAMDAVGAADFDRCLPSELR